MIRQWRATYQTGDIVMVMRDGVLTFAVCVDWTGDCHHKYVVIKAEQVENSGQRSRMDRLTACDEEFSGYYVGPKVGHISTTQIPHLGTGLEVKPLMISGSATDLALQLNHHSVR